MTQNTQKFIQVNALQNAVCRMAAIKILSRPRCVLKLYRYTGWTLYIMSMSHHIGNTTFTLQPERRYKQNNVLVLLVMCQGTPSRWLKYLNCKRIVRLSFRSIDSWWRHQMKTVSALLTICAGNSPASGEFPTQRPVTRSFDVFCHLRPNKRLSKQSRGWWFKTLSRPLWRHCNYYSQGTGFWRRPRD